MSPSLGLKEIIITFKHLLSCKNKTSSCNWCDLTAVICSSETRKSHWLAKLQIYQEWQLAELQVVSDVEGKYFLRHSCVDTGLSALESSRQ